MKNLFLFSSLLFLLSCEPPEGGAQNHPLAEDPVGQEILRGNLSGAINDQMSGPTRDHCPDCTEQTSGPSSLSMTQGGGQGRTIRGEAQTTWNECGSGSAASGHKRSNFQRGQVTGYYLGTPTRCNRANISTEFLNFINRNLASCVSLSLRSQGVTAAVNGVVIGHRGITGDQNHSSRSLHSINRAIDVATLHIQLANGQVIERSANGQQGRNPHRDFYTNFRRCWSQRISSSHSSPCPGREPKGSIGHENSDHRGHLHLSLPHCPSRGFFSK